MPTVITGLVGRKPIIAASPSCNQPAVAKKRPCVHETPACSPIMAKWIAPEPSIIAATTHRSTVPTLVGCGRRVAPVMSVSAIDESPRIARPVQRSLGGA